MDVEKKINGNILDSIVSMVRKNYRIIRIRIQIERLQKQRNRQYTVLGRRLYKLQIKKELNLPEQKKVMAAIASCDDLLAEKLKELTRLVKS